MSKRKGRKSGPAVSKKRPKIRPFLASAAQLICWRRLPACWPSCPACACRHLIRHEPQPGSLSELMTRQADHPHLTGASDADEQSPVPARYVHGRVLRPLRQPSAVRDGAGCAALAKRLSLPALRGLQSPCRVARCAQAAAVLRVPTLVQCCILDGAFKTDAFGRVVRRKPQRYRGIARICNDTAGSKARF